MARSGRRMLCSEMHTNSVWAMAVLLRVMSIGGSLAHTNLVCLCNGEGRLQAASMLLMGALAMQCGKAKGMCMYSMSYLIGCLVHGLGYSAIFGK